MKSKKVNDLNARKYYLKNELKIRRSKYFLYQNFNFDIKRSDITKYFCFFKLNNIYNKTSKYNKVKNRCFLTGRSKSINRFFRLSRNQLKFWTNRGLLNGIRKSCW